MTAIRPKFRYNLLGYAPPQGYVWVPKNSIISKEDQWLTGDYSIRESVDSIGKQLFWCGDRDNYGFIRKKS